MTMLAIEHKTEFHFHELDDAAKAKAIDTIRCSEGYLSYDWWDCEYDAFENILQNIGFTLSETNGKKQIFFSGFCTQGDGLCFMGKLYPKDVPEEFNPWVQDEDVIAICTRIREMAKALKAYDGYVRVTHSNSNYVHSNTAIVTVETEEDPPEDFSEMEAIVWRTVREHKIKDIVESDMAQALRDLMDWMYWSLEQEYDYLMSDDAITEYIENCVEYQRYDITGEEIY